MSDLSKVVWDKLKLDGIKGSTLWARRVPFDSSDRLLAALDAGERRHWLIRVEPHEEAISDLKSRGLSIQTQELEGTGHPLGRYIDLVCLDSAGHDAFDLIGKELAARLDSHIESSSECVTRVIAKWRRFWEHRPQNVLSKDAQIGLFAEIWFLALWMIPNRGVSAVHAWRGPFRSRHDFEWSTRSVEVKATLAVGARAHRINGIDQLALPEMGDLLLFSLHLREEQGASNTLPSVISVCRDLLLQHVEELEQFEIALSTSGYSDVYRDEYENMRIRVVDERLYRVTDQFPRLTIENFTGSSIRSFGSAIRHRSRRFRRIMHRSPSARHIRDLTRDGSSPAQWLAAALTQAHRPY